MNTENATKANLASRHNEDISSMLLPMSGFYLLLPGVSVAEIVTFVPPEEDHDEEVPDWFLGTIYWRNQRVPMVSYESMTGGGKPFLSSQCRIAVLNNSGLSHQLNFYAILLQGTPRLLRLTQDEVTVNNEKILDEGQKLHVLVSGDEAIIPDLQFIEKGVINYLGLT
jgi:chemosensory pili system protein ChpC